MSKKNKVITLGKVKTDYTGLHLFTEPGEFEGYKQSLAWGTGVIKPKKGRGSYTRKSKYKQF